MNDIYRNIRRGERKECWCGAELLPFTHHPGYGVCVSCGCYVNRYPPLDLQALYASDLYWHFLQQQYGYPPIELRGELYKRDGRLGYWLNLIEHYGPPSGTVIEVGCAPGVLLAELQQRGYRCIGVEPDAKTADWVRQNFTVEVLAGLFPGISLPSCHLFLAFDVLEHSPSPDLFMREVARLLDQGGVAIIQTPVERYGFDPPFGEAFRNAFKEIEHLFLFTNRALKLMAERSGLEIVTMSERLWLHHEICILRKPARDPAKALDPFSAVESLPYRVVNGLREDKLLSLQGEASAQPDLGQMESATLNEELAGGPAVRGKTAGARHIVIDGVIFQLQTRRPLGISRVWCNLIPALVASLPGYSITVLRRKGFPTGISGVNEREIPAYHMESELARETDSALLTQVCAELNADIFLSTYYTYAPGIRNVLMIHDMIPEIKGFDLSQPEWRAKQEAIAHADSYIAVSNSTRNDLIRLQRIPAHRIAVAHNGVSAAFQPAPEESIKQFMDSHGLRFPYVILAGNRGLYKNCGTFFQALASLPERNRLEVFAFGGEQYLLPEEARYAAECRVSFCKWLSDSELSAAYSGALALVYPSRYEGFGLPVLEAMACGCPVITGCNSSLPEVGGGAALYVNPDSVDEIAGAIRDVLQPDVRARLATDGIEQAGPFSWPAMARIVSGVIRDDLACSMTVSQSAVKEAPLVSAIVSVYNAERFICGCLDDLERQTIADRLEIIIVNSGSPQGEDTIIREYMTKHENIVYIKTDRRETIYSAWNRGIKAARGKYITNANTDDRHRRDAFEVLARTLNEQPDVTLVYADSLITNTENETFETAHPAGIFQWPEYDRQALFNRCFIGPQPMWRREVHKEYGYFDESFVSAGDYEFWLRISATSRFLHVKETLGLYLSSPTGIERGNVQQSMQESRQARTRHHASLTVGSSAALPPWPEEIAIHGEHLVAANDQVAAADSLPAKSSWTNGPMVSVIVPTYNRPETLIIALRSILDQTYQDFEIIVVNDAGSDVENIVRFLDKDRKITYIRHGSNRDRAAARNTAIKVARGKYIAYLDDDDLYYPDHLETLVAYLQKNGSRVAYTDAHRAHQEKMDGRYAVTKREIAYSLDFDYDRILVHNFVPVLCLMHEKECLNVVGLFDESLTTHEDWDLLIRLSRRFQCAHIKKITCEFVSRTDGSTTTSAKLPDFRRTMAIVLERHMASASEKPHVRAAQERVLQRLRGGTAGANVGAQPVESQQVVVLLQQVDEHCKTGDFQRAREILGQALEVLPDDPQLLLTMGNIALRLGDVEEARREFVKVVVLHPDYAPAHADLAAVLLHLGRGADAERSARRALELDSTNIGALKILAKVCLDTERYQEAVQAYATILQHAPDDIETLILVGNCYAETGRLEQARGFYGKALGLDPGNQIATDNLAEVERLAAVAPATVETGTSNGAGSHPSPLTSIIILTHNGLEHTKQCLTSIEAHTPEPHELIIVDNGSTDGTLDYLREHAESHKNVRVIANRGNRGFAAGNNQGLALAKGDYLLLLNNDTVVTAGWLGRMLTVFDRHPEVGIVGPVSNHVSGPQRVKKATYASPAEMQVFVARWAAEHSGRSRPILRVVGFCLLMRRAVIDRIGGLDERFGSGNFEDDDLCLRAAQVGFVARIAEDVFIHHTGSQTFMSMGIDYRKSMERNWELFKAKWGIPMRSRVEQGYRLPLRLVHKADLTVPLSDIRARYDAEMSGRWWAERQDSGTHAAASHGAAENGRAGHDTVQGAEGYCSALALTGEGT